MSNNRYRRHGEAFPDSRRLQTALAELGGESAPWTSRFLITGAAAAGLPQIQSDYPGGFCGGDHWLFDSHDRLIATINDQVQFDFVDPAPAMLSRRLTRLASSFPNTWLVVHGNRPTAVLDCLRGLSPHNGLSTLLVITGPGGFLIERLPHPAAAAARLEELGDVPIASAGEHADLPVAAAGAVLNEMMLGPAAHGDDLQSPRIVAFYSLHRPTRVKIEAGERVADLAGEIREAPAGKTRYRGRRLILVGAGALGQWASLAIALDRSVVLDVHDGDRIVELHNLARQILLVGNVGQYAKARVVATQLAAIDPEGRYSSHVQFIENAKDLGSLEVDTLLCLPDNDRVRAVTASAAWEAGIPYAQAGTSATGGQATIQTDRCCLECLLGIPFHPLPPRTGTANSCALAPDSVVASNMVLAGLLVAELRRYLAGHRPVNPQFHGTGSGGNRLTTTIGMPSCPHRRIPFVPCSS